MKLFYLTFALVTAFPLHAKEKPLPAPPALPSPVASFGAASANGRFFVYGGHEGQPHSYNRDDVKGNLYMWQPGAKEWKLAAEGEPSQGASLVSDGKLLYRIGGMAARNTKEERQELWSSNTATAYSVAESGTAESKALPDLPDRRSSHDSVIVDHTLYVFGGWKLDGGGRKGGGEWHETYLTLDLNNIDAGWQSHSQPFAKRAVAVAAASRKIYVIGGMDEEGETRTDTHVLDLDSGKWSMGPALPEHKLGGFGFACVAVGRQVYASGTEGSLLKLAGDEWKPVAKLAQPRFFHRLLSSHDGLHLLAMGGVTSEHGKAEPEWITIPANGETSAVTPTLNTLCPLMPKESIESHHTIDFQGIPIALCCGHCEEAWNQSDTSAAYYAKLGLDLGLLPQLEGKEQALGLDNIELLPQRFCPVKNKMVVSPDSPSTDYHGVKIWFSSEKALKTWEKNPDLLAVEATKRNLLPQLQTNDRLSN